MKVFFPRRDAKKLVSGPHQCVESDGRSGTESVREVSNMDRNAVHPLHLSSKSGTNDALTPCHLALTFAYSEIHKFWYVNMK